MSGYTEYLRSTSTIGFVGFFLALLVFGPILVFRALVGLGGGTGSVAVGATIVVSLSVLVLFADAVRRRRSEKPASGPSDDDGAGIWALIPSWQYNGLYAETGASTRDEQEKALRETHEKAAEVIRPSVSRA